MKVGTPGFVGAQLRRAREARDLSAIALAEILGISRAAVSQYESGVQTPRPQIMEKLIQILRLPEVYFYQDVAAKTGTVFYRSLSAATKTARTRAEVRFLWLKQIVAYLRKFVQSPPLNLPKLNLPQSPRQISCEEIEHLALEARRFWKLGEGPLGNLVWLLENNGIIVARFDLDADTLDAFSEFDHEEGQPYIILGSDKGVAVRSRYDVAHELGHILLHKGLDQTRLMKPVDHQTVEAQAHWFAGAFLLPAQSYAKDFYSASLDLLSRLKPKWRVSIAMMLKRATDLEFISADQAKSFWINYARRGWRKGEPLDNEYEPEQPCFLRKCTELIVDEGVQTKEELLQGMALAPRDIETLIGLKAGYFDLNPKEAEPTVRFLDFSKRPEAEKTGSKARIVKFRK